MAATTTISKSSALARNVTPPQAPRDSSLPKELQVSTEIVNELLLICGVIGSTTTNSNPSNAGAHKNSNSNTKQASEQVVPVSDCLLWLQDLQRVLRRDSDLYRPIALLCHDWNISSHKLLPLLRRCSAYDSSVTLTILKMMVILTKPLSNTAVNAARRSVGIKSKGEWVPEDVRRAQGVLRENAVKQSEAIGAIQREIVTASLSKIDESKKEKTVLGVVLSLLHAPLSKPRKTDSDHLILELVLHLLRNLLKASPVIKTTHRAMDHAKKWHANLLKALDQELALDWILLLSQDVDLERNQRLGGLDGGMGMYNLLVLEVVGCLILHVDPRTLVGKHNGSNRTTSANSEKIEKKDENSLTALLKREKSRIASTRNFSVRSRHGRFGGAIILNSSSNPRRLLTSSQMLTNATAKASSSTSADCSQPVPHKRSQKDVAFSSSSDNHWVPDSATRDILSSFFQKFLEGGYGPLITSLKNEFRRDSSRLEPGDTLLFLQLITFASRYVTCTKIVGNVVFSMDVFTFRFVINALTTATSLKQYRLAEVALGAYTEMMGVLLLLASSKETSEVDMSVGLSSSLFYGDQPMDVSLAIIRDWKAGVYSLGYGKNIVRLMHSMLKLLEHNRKASPSLEENIKPTTRIEKLQQIARDYSINAWFGTIVTLRNFLPMVTHMLSHYHSNPPEVNHGIVSVLVKLCRHVTYQPEEKDDQDDGGDGSVNKRKKLRTNATTLEPMLYNLTLIQTFSTILNDRSLSSNQNFSNLRKFAATIVRHFAAACEQNPILFVEALFVHKSGVNGCLKPEKYCELLGNNYVEEEIEIIEEIDALREQDGVDEGEDDDDAHGMLDTIVETRVTQNAANPYTVTNKKTNNDEEEEWDDKNDVIGVEKEVTNTANTQELVQDITTSDETQTNYDDVDMVKDNISINYEDDDKWNDRRTFVPKRKRLTPTKVTPHAVTNENQDGTAQEKIEVEKPQTKRSPHKRLRKMNILSDTDDDDDLEFEEIEPSTGHSSSVQLDPDAHSSELVKDDLQESTSLVQHEGTSKLQHEKTNILSLNDANKTKEFPAQQHDTSIQNVSHTTTNCSNSKVIADAPVVIDSNLLLNSSTLSSSILNPDSSQFNSDTANGDTIKGDNAPNNSMSVEPEETSIKSFQKAVDVVTEIEEPMSQTQGETCDSIMNTQSSLLVHDGE